MNGGIKGRVSPNNHSAELFKGLRRRESSPAAHADASSAGVIPAPTHVIPA